ncbi:MAG TPA: polysaccharide biosynthesis tyrosine autokinase [Terrimicrobiaceae bacterium]
MNNTSSDPSGGDPRMHFLDYWRVIRIRLPLIFLVFVLVVGTGSIITYLMPRRYMSSVTMQIKESDTSLKVFNRDAVERFDPRFVTTQFEIIQRKEILYPVIENLQLEKKWGVSSREVAYAMLRKRLTMRELRNTDLIQISILDQDRQLAADITNAIAEEYQRRRIVEQQDWVNRSLIQLQGEVDKQRGKVDDLRETAARIRVQHAINDLNPESAEDPMQATERVLLSEEEQVNNERLKVTVLRAKQDQVSQMTDDQIMRSTRALDIEDPTILQVLPAYQEAVSEDARLLNSGLGANHPTVKSLRARKEVMGEQLAEQIRVLRKTLADNLKIAEDQLAELETGLDHSRALQQESKTRASAYFVAKNEYIQAKKLLEAAEMRLSTETMQRTMPQSPVTIWERAEPSQFPARPRVFLNIALSALVGLVFGLGLAFFVEHLDTSVKTVDDVQAALAVPVLAVIPRNIKFLMDVGPDHADAEAYRILRTNIEFGRKSPEAKAILVTSGGPGEGKSTTAANLAYTFARGGYQTLLVDADMHRSTQGKIFGVANERGLADCLLSRRRLDEVIRVTSFENLYVLPSGRLSAEAIGILNSQQMVDFVEEAKSRFDILFFDAPPILGMSDAAVLASLLDSVVVVVQHRRFPRGLLQRIRQAVASAGGEILGVVLNNVDLRQDDYYGYASNYRAYYHKTRTTARKPAASPAVVAHHEKESY